MNTVLRSPFARISRFIGFACALLWPAAQLLAQQNNLSLPLGQPTSDLETRKVDLTLEDQPLVDILKTLSVKIGHGIVMDGKPVLSHASFTFHASAKEALDRIAESFDCSWKVGRSGAILMSKRFHTPGDLPQIHLKEMQRMAADLVTIWPENACKLHLSSYPFVTAPISPGNALYRTFTSDQIKALDSGMQLAYQDLSAEQKDLVHIAMIKGSSGTSYDIWEGLNARLAKIPYVSLQWRSWFHGQLDKHPTKFQYSLDYIWPDLQDKGYERLISASKVYEATGEKAK